MKVKNIMFSGVMAAILMTASGAAMAEGEAKPVSVASTGYVEAKVGKVSQDVVALEANVAKDYQTKADAQTAAQGVESALGLKLDTSVYNQFVTTQAGVDKKQSEDIAANTQAINMLGGESGVDGVATLVQDVATNKSDIALLNDVDASKQGSVAYKIANAVIQQTQVQGLDTALQGKADASDLTSLAGKVDNEATGLAATYTIATGNKEAIEGLTDETTGILAQAKSYAETEDDKIEAKIGTVADGKTVVAMIGDVSTSVTSLKDTEVKANQDAIAKLNAADTEAGSVANTAKTTVQGYAIPKPNANCANEKCVLSVDGSGQPYWMELALSL